jgi:enoyl-CoA hydratase
MPEDSLAIVVEVDAPIAIVRFTNPQQRNPLSLATLKQLQIILNETTQRSDIECIIFTGSDEAFASGADIRELTKLNARSAEQFSRFGQQLFQTIADAAQLTIAAINGYCTGGAMDLAMACDIRIASPRAAFAHPGARLGIITGWGGTQRLSRVIGLGAALDLLLTARRINADDALRLGLVTRLAGDPVNAALSVFQQTRNST